MKEFITFLVQAFQDHPENENARVAEKAILSTEPENVHQVASPERRITNAPRHVASRVPFKLKK